MHILLIDDSSSTRSLLRTLINSGQTVRHEISEAETVAPQANEVAGGPDPAEEQPNPRMQGFIEEFKTGANTSSCK